MPRYRCQVRRLSRHIAAGLDRRYVTVTAEGPDDAYSVARQEASELYDWEWEKVEVVGIEPA